MNDKTYVAEYLFNNGNIRPGTAKKIFDELIVNDIYTTEELFSSTNEFYIEGKELKDYINEFELIRDADNDTTYFGIKVFRNYKTFNTKLEQFKIYYNLNHYSDLTHDLLLNLLNNENDELKHQFILLYLSKIGRFNSIGYSRINKSVYNLLSHKSDVSNDVYPNDNIIVRPKTIVDCLKYDFYGDYYLNDLVQVKDVNISNKINRKKYGCVICNKLNGYLPFLKTDVSDFDKTFWECISQMENNEYICRKANGETLESIGSSVGLTRERIRQVISKQATLLAEILNIYLYACKNLGRFDDSLLFYDLENVFSDFSIKSLQIISYVLKHADTKYIHWNKNLSSFTNIDDEELIQTLYVAIEPEDEYFNFTDKIDEIDKKYPKLNIYGCNQIVLVNLYDKQGFRLVNDKIISKDIIGSKASLLKYAILQYFPEGLCLDDEGFDELKDVLAQELEYHIKDDDELRNWFSKFGTEETKDLILWGISKRIHINNIDIDEYTKDEIIDCFNNAMSKTGYLVISDFFTNNRKLFEDTPIDDPYKAYGFLKYYLDDEYYFKKQSVRRIENKSYYATEQVVDFIKQNGRVVRSDVENNFSKTTVVGALEFSNDIIISGEYLYHSSLINMSNDDKQYLHEIIITLLQNSDFISMHKLYAMVQENRKSIIVNDAAELFYICKYFFDKEFNFFRPYIQRKDETHPIFVNDIVRRRMINDGFVNIDEITNYLYSEYIWLYSSHNLTTLAFKHKEKILKVDCDNICYDSLFNIDQESIAQVDSYITKKMNDTSLVFDYELDNDVFGWYAKVNGQLVKSNKYLIATIIQKYMSDKYDVFDNISKKSLKDNNFVITKKGTISSFEEGVIKHFKDKFGLLPVSDIELTSEIANVMKITKRIPLDILKLLSNYSIKGDDGDCFYIFNK